MALRIILIGPVDKGHDLGHGKVGGGGDLLGEAEAGEELGQVGVFVNGYIVFSGYFKYFFGKQARAFADNPWCSVFFAVVVQGDCFLDGWRFLRVR